MNPIPHNRPTLGADEEGAALRVLRSKWLAQGSEVAAFEAEFAALLGLHANHAVAVASGTAALFLALHALDAPKQRVAIPAYSCVSLRHAVRLSGATEAVVDCETNSPNADPNAVRTAKAPIAIMPHIFGIPAKLAELGNVRLIEDCAQSLGAIVKGIPAGLTGELGVYSFYATKLITTGGQGGMIVSRNLRLAEAARDYREFDMRRDDKSRFNFKMTDLQAAIGRAQLKKLPEFLSRREEIFQTYHKAGLDLLNAREADQNDVPVRYRAVLRTKNPRQLIRNLAAIGIESIVPIEEFELLSEPGTAPEALALCRSTVSLPLYPTLTDSEVGQVIAGVKA